MDAICNLDQVYATAEEMDARAVWQKIGVKTRLAHRARKPIPSSTSLTFTVHLKQRIVVTVNSWGLCDFHLLRAVESGPECGTWQVVRCLHDVDDQELGSAVNELLAQE